MGITVKILILGNIGAGKTTVAKQLQQKIGYELCPIDDFRKEYGDGTVTGEYLALYHFLKECSNNRNAILEFTGAGCHEYYWGSRYWSQRLFWETPHLAPLPFKDKDNSDWTNINGLNLSKSTLEKMDFKNAADLLK